jgi:ABC-type branched-subunit amino acid transport system ATPase component/branched-subunit amino acid ABC-type transport system permease component
VLPFIIAGLTTGGVYGLAGVGLVLTYKTSGILNFAHGAIAAVAAYLFYTLFVTLHWSWPVAALTVIVGVGVGLGLVMEILSRRASGKSLTLRVGVTVGVLLIIVNGISLIYGTSQTRTVPQYLAVGHSVDIAGTNVRVSDLIVFAVTLICTAVLSIFLARSRRGLTMKAVVENPVLLDLTGTNPRATRRYAWIAGVTLAALSGVLIAPLLTLDPIALTFLVVAAFGAAALGAFRHLMTTFVGGLAIGIAMSLMTKYFSSGLLAGLSPSLPFLVLFAAMLLLPRRYLKPEAWRPQPVRSNWRAPASLQITAGVVVVALLCFVPSMAGIHLTDWTSALAMSVLFMSLSLLVKTSGQVSLCHVSFAAIGVCAFAHLTTDTGLPWAVALLATAVVVAPIGGLLTLPAIRLSGIYPALATFGFGILLQYFLYFEGPMFGEIGSLDIPRPDLSGIGLNGDSGYYFLVLALTVGFALLMLTIERGRLGRLLRGAADSPTALRAGGASLNVTWTLAFCLSAGLAGVAGALVGSAQQVVSAQSYPPVISLSYFALIVIVGGGNPWNAVIASFSLLLIPSYIGGHTTTLVLQLIFGVSVVAYAVLPDSAQGTPVWLQRAIDRTFGRITLRRRSIKDQEELQVSRPKVADDSELKIGEVTVKYGGLVAVDSCSLNVFPGKVTGLIGPNGAGKTTMFNACSGLAPVGAGEIVLGGADLRSMSPARRARKGLGRTFQQLQLYESQTVRENVAKGVEAAEAGLNPLRHLAARPDQKRDRAAIVSEALEVCLISDLAETPVQYLSTGHRRLVELARCIAGPFDVLLLDEPSAGLDRAETAQFGEIVTKVVEERHVGVLLVEHDMDLVLGLCEDIYVLDFGRIVFQGSPKEVIASPVVQSAYLGSAAVEAVAGGASGQEH